MFLTQRPFFSVTVLPLKTAIKTPAPVNFAPTQLQRSLWYDVGIRFIRVIDPYPDLDPDPECPFKAEAGVLHSRIKSQDIFRAM